MNKLVTSVIILLFPFYFLQSQTHFSENPIPYTTAKEKADGYSKKIEMRNSSLFKNVEFRSVGPSVMSGRVVDLAVSPDDPTIFYVAYASGGLWKTTNNGISFSPLFDNESCIAIGAVAVDWKNNIIYVGTGESNSSRSSYSGTGIFKTTNDGKEWINIGLVESHRIGRIEIDPKNPERIWVAALGHLFSPNPERGIYKTADGGKTWKQTLYIDDNTGGIDLAVDPENTNIIFASMWFRERRAWDGYEAGKTSGIYKSTNGGDNWAFVSGAGSGFPAGDGLGRIGLAIYPKDTKIIYAVLDNLGMREKEKKEDEEKVTKDLLRHISKEDFLKLNEDDLNEYLDDNDFPKKYTAKVIFDMVRSDKIKPIALVEYLEDAESVMFNTEVIGAEVYRSDDGGTSWRKMNEKYINDLFYTYGYYFANIRVSPFNPDKIFVLGVPVIKSDDGGKTFKSVKMQNVHADNHAMWIDPKKDGHIILGSDGGVDITYDEGESWFFANTPPVGQFYSVNVDLDNPYNVYGGLQDNGVWYGPSSYKANYRWYSSGEYPYKSIMGGDGMQVAIDTRDNTIYTGYQFGNYYRFKRDAKDYKYITPKHDLGERPYRFNWQSPIQVSVHNQDVVYFGSNKLFRSLNKGDSFDVISGDLTNGGKKGKVPFGTLTTIHESPLKFGLIYTGSDDGAVYVTKDGGNDWERISDNLPQNYWISRMQASAFDTGTVYVSLNGFRWDNFEPMLYRSKNFGRDWEKIGLNLPIGSVNVVKEDPVNKDIIYAGTDFGVYISLNSGKDFMEIYKNLPNVPVHDLVIHPKNNDLVIGTHGRSIYIADVGYIQKLDDNILNKALNIFDIFAVTFNNEWGKKTYTWGETRIPDFKIVVYSNSNGMATIKIKTADTLILKEFQLALDKGLNYIKYDLSVDSDKINDYKNFIGDKSKYKVKESENGITYLLPGKYEIEITVNGNTEKKEFEIKEPKKKKRGEE